MGVNTQTKGRILSVQKIVVGGIERTPEGAETDGKVAPYMLIRGSTGNDVIVDSNGNLVCVLKGSENMPIAQDAAGNMVALMKGDFGGVLKTWKVDSDGRGEIFNDPILQWGTTISGIASSFDTGEVDSSKAYALTNYFGTDEAGQVLENANLSVAKAASLINNSQLTLPVLVAIMIEPDLTTERIATVFNHTNITAARLAKILARSDLQLSDAAAIFEDANLSGSRISSAIIHNNITDDRAQQILNETSYATRDLKTAVTAITDKLHDDFADNKVVTDRDDRGTTAWAGHDNLFAQMFRPKWKQESGQTGASGGKMEFNEADEEVSTPSTITTSSWSFTCTCNDDTNSNLIYLYFMYNSVASHNVFYAIFSSDSVHFYLGGSTYNGTHSFVSGNNYVFVITRNAAGNFNVGVGGVSEITCTNTTVTTSTEIRFENSHPGGAQCYHEIDLLSVQ